MKALLLTVGSVALSASVVANAYYQKKQFYPSVVYITKSNPSMAILYLQAFVMVILMGKLMRKVFFGQLRDAEMEHLIERSWYAVTETCLAFTVFRDDFSPRFVGLFTLLLFLKCFHWLAEDRIDYMERSPIIRWIFHIRAISLLGFLGILDLYFISHAYYSTLIKGASVQLVFGFEYAILFTIVLTVFMKYILHTIDLQSENPWLNKAVYMLYTDLVLGFVKVVLYVLFLVIMIKIHTFPLFAIRPMYLTMRSFKKALNDVVMSRRAIKNMNTLYPDATPEELQSGDNVCIICREVMASNSKKLPCNHIFHMNCLRSWFLRQQTCPTCRMDVLRAPGASRPQGTPAAAAAPPPPQGPAEAAGQAGQPQQPPQAFFPGFPFGVPAWNQQPRQAQPPATSGNGTSTSTTATSGAYSTPAGAAIPASPAFTAPFGLPPFGMMPPFGMGMPPFITPPPMPDSNFAGLTEEELRLLEGQERENLESRIRVLRNIHTLLDAAMIQVQQYSSAVSSQSMTGRPMSSGGISSVQATTTIPQTSFSHNNTTSTSTVPSSSSTSVTPSTVTASSTSELSKDTVPSVLQQSFDVPEDVSDLEGAVGYTNPESAIPEWDSSEQYLGDEGELSEMRRRRLERFSVVPPLNKDKKVEDNIDLD